MYLIMRSKSGAQCIDRLRHQAGHDQASWRPFTSARGRTRSPTRTARLPLARSPADGAQAGPGDRADVRLSFRERLAEVLHELLTVLFGEHVPDAQRDGYRPVKNAERGKGSQAAVVGKSFRLRQAKRAPALGQRHGNGMLVDG